MRFEIIERKKNYLGLITNSQWALIAFFLFLFLVLKFIENQYIDFVMLFFLFTLLGIIAYRYMDYEKLNSIVIGDLIVDQNCILINNQRINFETIHSINLDINHYFSELQNIGINDFYKPQYLIGKGNYFEIITNNNLEYKGEFLINNRIDFLNLKDFTFNQI